MTQDLFQTPSPQDVVLLRKILLKLTAASKILVAALIVLAMLIWYELMNRLLAFGNGIDYAGNHIMGAEATALLQRYNPYFWGALVILCALITAWIASLAIRSVLARARLKLVDEASFELLTTHLSPPALDVLLWAWQARDEPLRVNDLQLARQELAAGRSGRLQLAARQQAALESARVRTPEK